MRRWKQIWQTRPHILKSGCPHIMERYARKDGFILWSNSHFHFIISQSMTSLSPPYIWRALFCTVECAFKQILEKYSNLRGSLLLKKYFSEYDVKSWYEWSGVLNGGQFQIPSLFQCNLRQCDPTVRGTLLKFTSTLKTLTQYFPVGL